MVNNDGETDDGQVQELILDDQLLGTTLTAITLPDGTQAFVTENFEDDGGELIATISPRFDPIDPIISESEEYKEEEPALELENGSTILLRDFTDLNSGKTLQFELDPASFLQSQLNASENNGNTYPQVELINGTAYMVAGHVDVDEGLWEIAEGTIKEDEEEKIVVNKISETKLRNQHPCPREGCTKVYSTPHHLKVDGRGLENRVILNATIQIFRYTNDPTQDKDRTDVLTRSVRRVFQRATVSRHI